MQKRNIILGASLAVGLFVLLLSRRARASKESADTAFKGKFVDFRAAVQDDLKRLGCPAPYSENKSCKQYGQRSWADVKGITLHQTAAFMTDAYGVESPKRFINTGAHMVITRSGNIYWLADFDTLVIHGNSFNSYDIGIEINGAFPGIEGDLSTFWKANENSKPMVPTDAQIAAVKAAVRFAYHRVAEHGGRLLFLHAHRQASDTRPSDPGSAIWKRAALPLQRELGLTSGPVGYKAGDGYPIPEVWDPKQVGIRY